MKWLQAALLGDFGASVIRVDKLGGSEDRFVMPVGHGLDGTLFLQVNRNQRSLTLDTQVPAGREVLHRLVAGSDIVVVNLPQKALTQRNRVGSGNRSQISGPADVFRTSDGEIVMQAVGDQMFRRWAGGLTQTDGTHLFGKVSPQAIDLVGRFVQTDGYHLSGSHH